MATLPREVDGEYKVTFTWSTDGHGLSYGRYTAHFQRVGGTLRVQKVRDEHAEEAYWADGVDITGEMQGRDVRLWFLDRGDPSVQLSARATWDNEDDDVLSGAWYYKDGDKGGDFRLTKV